MSTIILAIESSCDDTSAAVIKDGIVLSNYIANQEVHKKYGGVVPEVASRAHQENIIPVVDVALKEAGVSKEALSAIAFTRGPGLIGALIVGVSFAKAMALGLGIPIIDVHHLRAHILSHFAELPHPDFPFLCLTVSGGHTQIVLVKDFFEMEILGSTLDDAAGEAFDKSGKLIGLDYPAGPQIDKLAQNGLVKFTFPKPKVGALDFSFSGLKTSILYFLKKELKNNPDFINEHLRDICASIQHSIVEILINKLIKAAEQTKVANVALAGGVSANTALRSRLEQIGIEKGWKTYIPRFEFCTDNAAMVGIAAYYKFKRGLFAAQNIKPAARMELDNL